MIRQHNHKHIIHHHFVQLPGLGKAVAPPPLTVLAGSVTTVKLYCKRAEMAGYAGGGWVELLSSSNLIGFLSKFCGMGFGSR